MEKIDSLKRDDQVTVVILGPDDKSLYKSTNSGYHNLETAVSDAIQNANLDINPQDCVFEVTNQTTDVTHRYRLNAHDHLKLII